MVLEQCTRSVWKPFLGVVLVALAAVLMSGGAGARQATLERVTVAAGWMPGSATRVTFEVSADVPLAIYTAAGPDRIAIDLEGVSSAGVILSQPEGQIADVRAGWIAPGTTRVLLTLRRPAKVARVERSTVDGVTEVGLILAEMDRAAFDARAQGDAARWPAPRKPRLSVSGAPTQPLVMLDPGHGGVDPGAIREEVAEKDIALTFATEFAAALLSSGRYRVALTRETDVYVGLRDRVSLAREAGADVFLSLHANTVTVGSVQGAAVYTLSDTASDGEAAALAALENGADFFGTPDGGAGESDVTRVLLDLARAETDTRSRTLARAMVPALAQTAGIVPRNPHKSAGFRVLKAPDIPSVLVELGFLSDAADRRRMQSPVWRALAIEGLIDALDAWTIEDAQMRARARQ